MQSKSCCAAAHYDAVCACAAALRHSAVFIKTWPLRLTGSEYRTAWIYSHQPLCFSWCLSAERTELPAAVTSSKHRPTEVEFSCLFEFSWRTKFHTPNIGTFSRDRFCPSPSVGSTPARPWTFCPPLLQLGGIWIYSAFASVNLEN